MRLPSSCLLLDCHDLGFCRNIKRSTITKLEAKELGVTGDATDRLSRNMLCSSSLSAPVVHEPSIFYAVRVLSPLDHPTDSDFEFAFSCH